VIVVPWFASAVDEYQRIDALVKAMMVADGLGMIAERGWRPLVNGDFARTYGTRVVVVMHRGEGDTMEWRLAGGPKNMAWQGDVRKAVRAAELWVRRQMKGCGKGE
jgi:hypothetical protein